MNAVLKSGSAALQTKVRPFAASLALRPADPPPPDPELVRLSAALVEAETTLAERDKVIAGIPGRIEAASAEGERKGRAAADEREAERLAMLGDAAERALARLGEEMASLERLGALLAITCLDRMLLNQAERAGTVTALLRAQLARLEAGAALSVQVSAEDFPSPEALAAITPASCEIIVSAALKSGDCIIQLRLGTLEIGINQQWGSLRATLEEIAA